MRITGPSRTHLDQLGDEFAELVTAAVREALRVAAKDIKATSTPDDLAVIRRVLTAQVEDTLLPHLAARFDDAAHQQRARVLEKVTTAAGPVVPPLASTLSEQYLATASNRLVGVSDEVWEHARSEMLAGLQNGESIPQIRKRITAATDLAAPRAQVIARTEVIGATNRGSLEQMKAAGYPAEKTWLATRDARTRPSHGNANGQTVRLEESFTVGGHSMDGPHDPFGPPGETISCRCTLTYEIADDELVSADPGAGAYRPAAHNSLDSWGRDLVDLPDPQTSVVNNEDGTIKAMWKKQGFDGLPAKVSASELDQAVASGAKEIFRGISAPGLGVGQEAAGYAEAFKSGEVFAGLGNYGNGSYFGAKRAIADQYAGAQGAVIRAALRPDARVAVYEDIQHDMSQLLNQGLLPGLDPGDSLTAAYRLFDPGRYASALGYDAITARGGEYVVVLNRTALLVES